MPVSEIFPNPTVKSVIFQIRYPNLFYIENRIGDIQLKLMKEFPESALLYRQRIVFADIGPDVKIEKDFDKKGEEAATKIWQFKSSKKYELNILSDSLDISSQFHKTYNNPESSVKFRDTIELVLTAFFEITQVPIVKRIGLRYIDECPIPKKTTRVFREHYNTTFPLSRFKLEDATEMQFTSIVRRKGYSLRFVESLAKIKDEHKLILDFDGFGEDINSTDCMKVTDKLHDLIAEEYRKSLKEPVYEYMRKKAGSEK